MKTCEVCGNSYDKAFDVSIGGTSHTFDSFACAIHALAPRCYHCSVPIIGQGIEARGQYFCCAHCARMVGVQEVTDRAPDGGEAHP
jgi:hypothetical protein